MLAIDLSLSSLAYAQRKTRELGLPNIEYAQADVLALGSIGRSFDVIDASGVLHHLSDPAAGWRALLSLLRPGGLMRVGLYSELGRADIVAARQFIAERGFDATAADIRRCRQELLATPLRCADELSGFLQHQRMPRSAVPRAGASVRHSADQGISRRRETCVPRLRIACRRVAGLPNEIPQRSGDDRSGMLGCIRARAPRDVRRRCISSGASAAETAWLRRPMAANSASPFWTVSGPAVCGHWATGRWLN